MGCLKKTAKNSPHSDIYNSTLLGFNKTHAMPCNFNYANLKKKYVDILVVFQARKWFAKLIYIQRLCLFLSYLDVCKWF